MKPTVSFLLAVFLAVVPARGYSQKPAFGPWHRDLYIQESADGLVFGPAKIFVERAGVPSAAVDAKGRLVAVFQWFPFHRREAFDRIAVSVSSDDGQSWTRPEPIVVDGLPEDFERPYDPTVVRCDDGKLRLYFTSRAGRRGRQAIFSGLSSDGQRYTFEPGVRFSVEDGEQRAYDCAVARLGKTWHLYAPVPAWAGRGYHAVAQDGLNFKQVADVRIPGQRDWLGNVLPHKDGLRFYGTGQDGMWVAFSPDGSTWELEAGGGQRGGDPGIVRTRAGRYLRIFTGGLRADAKE